MKSPLKLKVEGWKLQVAALVALLFCAGVTLAFSTNPVVPTTITVMVNPSNGVVMPITLADGSQTNFYSANNPGTGTNGPVITGVIDKSGASTVATFNTNGLLIITQIVNAGVSPYTLSNAWAASNALFAANSASNAANILATSNVLYSQLFDPNHITVVAGSPEITGDYLGNSGTVRFTNTVSGALLYASNGLGYLAYAGVFYYVNTNLNIVSSNSVISSNWTDFTGVGTCVSYRDRLRTFNLSEGIGDASGFTNIQGSNIAGGSVPTNALDANVLGLMRSGATGVVLGGFVVKSPGSSNTILGADGSNVIQGIVDARTVGFNANAITQAIAGFASTGTVAHASEAAIADGSQLVLNGGPTTMGVLGHIQGDATFYNSIGGVTIGNNTNLTVTGTNRSGWFYGNAAGLTGIPGGQITAGTINSNALDVGTLALLGAGGGGGAATNIFVKAGTNVTVTTNAPGDYTVAVPTVVTTNDTRYLAALTNAAAFDTNGAAAAYTAALARTNGAINLLDVGAVAGGADCYSAITNAIGAGGRAVTIPVGRFRIGSLVAVPANTTFIAADPVNSVLYSTNNNQMFLVNAGASNVVSIGVTFEGNWAGTTQYGFQTGVPNSANVSFFNCTFRNLSRGLQFENLGTIGGQPYYQGSFVSNCRFFNCSVAGLYLNGGAEYITVTGCHSYSNALGLVVYGGNNNIVANDFTANITNVFYKAVPLGNSDHANFKGNSVNHATSGVGLVLDPIRYSMQFEGNYFYDTTNFLSGTNVTFANNTFVVPGNTNVVQLYLTNVDNMRFINNWFQDGAPNFIATNSNWYEEGLDSTNGFYLKHNGTLVFRFDTTGAFIANGSGVTNIPIASIVNQGTTNANLGAQIAALIQTNLTYDSTFTGLQNRGTALENKTNTTDAAITDLRAGTNALNTAIGALQTRATALEGATGTLNTAVSAISANYMRTNSDGGSITNIQSTNIVTAVKAAFSTNYVVVGRYNILACTGTNQIITLTNNLATGFILHVSATTATSSVILTNYNGSQTIGGQLSQTIPGTNSATVWFDGSNWQF